MQKLICIQFKMTSNYNPLTSTIIRDLTKTLIFERMAKLSYKQLASSINHL